MEALSRRDEAGRALRAAPIPSRLFSARLTVTLLLGIVTVLHAHRWISWKTCTPSTMHQQH